MTSFRDMFPHHDGERKREGGNHEGGPNSYVAQCPCQHVQFCLTRRGLAFSSHTDFAEMYTTVRLCHARHRKWLLEKCQTPQRG